MDRELQIMDLPVVAPLSRLEPHREFILRLRRDGRSYRQIRTILAERCSLQISRNALFEFVKRRSRPRKHPVNHAALEHEPAYPQAVSQQPTPQDSWPKIRRTPEEVAEMRARARAANHKPTVKPEPPPIFIYDPTKPLTNRPNGTDATTRKGHCGSNNNSDT
jgi:hypothetical protein